MTSRARAPSTRRRPRVRSGSVGIDRAMTYTPTSGANEYATRVQFPNESRGNGAAGIGSAVGAAQGGRIGDPVEASGKWH